MGRHSFENFPESQKNLPFDPLSPMTAAISSGFPTHPPRGMGK